MGLTLGEGCLMGPLQYWSYLWWFNAQIPLLFPEGGILYSLYLRVFEVYFCGSGKNSAGRNEEVAGRCFAIPWELVSPSVSC